MTKILKDMGQLLNQNIDMEKLENQFLDMRPMKQKAKQMEQLKDMHHERAIIWTWDFYR